MSHYFASNLAFNPRRAAPLFALRRTNSRAGAARCFHWAIQAARLLLLIALPLVYVVAPAIAYPNFPPIVKGAYNWKTGGKVQSASETCLLCHLVAGQPKFNAYGNDVKAALESAHTKNLTPEILHSLDAKDSDGDGFTNGEEFAADTIPGDPASKPAGTPTAKNAASAVSASPSAPAAESNPFDVKTLLLPKHAQHPVIVHFPIALFIISLFFDAIGLKRRDKTLAATGYLNLTVAAVTSLFALITGLLAWNFAYGGISAASLHGTLLQHLVLSIVTTILIWVLWGMRFSKRHEGFDTVKTPYIIIGLIALIVISITGHLGGYLSGVN